MKKPKISIICAVKNHWEDYTKPLILNLKETIGWPAEMYIIDGASEEAQWDELVNFGIRTNWTINQFELYPIRLTPDPGLAACLNKGLEKATGEYICTMANDIVLSKGWATRLMTFLDMFPELGVVSPQVSDSAHPGWLNHIGIHGCELDKKELLPGLKACLLFTKRERRGEIGYFDPQFFLGWEDVDWYYRFWKEGYEPSVIPSLVIGHQQGTWAPDRHIKIANSQKKFLSKWNIPYPTRDWTVSRSVLYLENEKGKMIPWYPERRKENGRQCT